MIVKHKGIKEEVQATIRMYKNRQVEEQDRINNIFTMWPKTDAEEAIKKNKLQNWGPVGLLLADLKHYGYTMEEDLIMKSHNEINIDLMNIPWQHLKKAMFDIVARNRAKETNKQRTFCGDIEEIDEEMLKR